MRDVESANAIEPHKKSVSFSHLPPWIILDFDSASPSYINPQSSTPGETKSRTWARLIMPWYIALVPRMIIRHEMYSD